MAAEKSKKPSLFDPEALMEAQRRNFQALANAGNIVADGMRSYAERQAAMVRESMGHLWSELQTVGKKTPAAPTDQLERMRSAFEKVVAQVQELGQHMLEVQSQAMAVLNECATKNLEVLGTAAPELAALQQKAKSAFEHASQQTSAVIDEMKKRMSTLEHETKAAAATPAMAAPKPAEVKPPAPKPPRRRRPSLLPPSPRRPRMPPRRQRPPALPPLPLRQSRRRHARGSLAPPPSPRRAERAQPARLIR